MLQSIAKQANRWRVTSRFCAAKLGPFLSGSRFGSDQAMPFTEASGGQTRPVANYHRYVSGKANTFGYSPNDGSETHFGYETVARNEKQDRVAEVFHSVADSYDLMNDVMSVAVHRVWKDVFVRRLGPEHAFLPLERQGDVKEVCFLDVAGGTGDIAFRICDAIKNEGGRAPHQTARVIVSDINASMLAVGQDRWQKREGTFQNKNTEIDIKVEFLEASAEEVPLPDNSVDAFTISFGIRNVTNIDIALSEAYRVLKPGGRFMCLEFSKVTIPGVREFYDTYSENVIPVMGEHITGDRDSYQYLVESIRRFPPQEAFATMIRDAGFQEVEYENMTGGVVCIHSGFKIPF